LKDFVCSRASKLKFKGKGHELTDLRMMLTMYEVCNAINLSEFRMILELSDVDW
jgi:hypothetical protein